MKVFIGCECSGVGRRAWRAAGHDVISADLKIAEDDVFQLGIPSIKDFIHDRLMYNGLHIMGDVFEILAELKRLGWAPDLVIAHPTCTYLTNSGICALYQQPNPKSPHILKGPKRWQAMFEAAEFFNRFKGTAPKVCIENPQPHRFSMALIGKYTQAVQPYEHGHLESKRTCLWLEGLPELEETNNVKAEMDKLPIKERQKCWWGGSRSKVDRSRSYAGILQAMVDQWGKDPLDNGQPIEIKGAF